MLIFLQHFGHVADHRGFSSGICSSCKSARSECGTQRQRAYSDLCLLENCHLSIRELLGLNKRTALKEKTFLKLYETSANNGGAISAQASSAESFFNLGLCQDLSLTRILLPMVR